MTKEHRYLAAVIAETLSRPPENLEKCETVAIAYKAGLATIPKDVECFMRAFERHDDDFATTLFRICRIEPGICQRLALGALPATAKLADPDIALAYHMADRNFRRGLAQARLTN